VDDDEDRRTIRGDPDVGDDAKSVNGGGRGTEKLGEVAVHAPTTPPPPVTPIK
jgi:hypothetical protein